MDARSVLDKLTLRRVCGALGPLVAAHGSSAAARRLRPCTRSARPRVLASPTSRPSTIRSAARRRRLRRIPRPSRSRRCVDVTIALQSATISVAAGATNEALLFLVTNTGNGAETFTLAGDSVLVGDDFDPAPAAPFIYFDSDSSGDLSPADMPYVAGSNDPCSRRTPASRSSSSTTFPLACPTATSAAASSPRRPPRARVRRAPCSWARQRRSRRRRRHERRPGRRVRRVPRRRRAVVGGEVAGRARSVRRHAGRCRAPRSRYQIVVTATGTGAALGAALTDPIPANTTYVAGSLSLNGAPLTDATDGDAGSFARHRRSVAVSLGDLTAAAGPQTIVFRVTID